MSVIYRVTRRDFLRDAGVAAGALVFGSYLLPENLFGKDVKADLGKVKEILHNHLTLNPFVAIQPLDGTIVIVTFRPEMGQGIRSTLAAVLADELEADWSRVKLHQADCDSLAFALAFPYKIPPGTKLPYPFDIPPFTEPPTDKPMYVIGGEGSQFADSSRSMTAYFQAIRLTGAGIKLVFLRAAALKFGVDISQLRAQQHKIYHDASGRSVEYHHLLLEAGKVAIPLANEAEDALKQNPSEWRFIGKEGMPFVDAPNMVMGKVEYGADINVPGMLTAMVERCHVANGVLVSFDATEALAVPGVRKVTAVLPPGLAPGGVGRAFVPHAGVAVIADNTWAALKGRRALRDHIKWDYPKDNDHSHYESSAFRDELEKSTNAAGDVVRKKGDAMSAIASAVTQVKADYYVPLLAQAPMEPPMAIALLKNDHSLEVWAPTQNPDASQQMAGRLAFGIPEKDWAKEDMIARMRKDVTLHMPLVGGGFGRKSKPDYIGEAALLAAQNPGVPIRVQWTREDDIQFSYYNAVSSQHLEAGLDADGHPTGLLLRSAFTSFLATIFPPSQAEARAAFFDSGKDKYGSGIERAQGLEDMPYDLSNIQIENCPATNHIRTGWMRSVANIYHAFGICSFAGEMAVAAGRDCKDYLLELIGKGRILPLPSEGVKRFRNNELPLEMISVPIEGGKIRQVVPGFPPDTQRLIDVVKRVATESGWDEKVKRYKGMKGRGLGIAAHRSFLSYAAIVADVTLTDSDDPNGAKELKVNEIWGVIDCGLAVNPDRVRAQMEGGINYGLSYGLLGEITVKDGGVMQHNFDDYPVLRMHQAPKINVYIMKNDHPPSGVGEPPTPAVAPAVANAIVAAGGPRIRAIPFAAKVDSDKTKVIVR